MSKYDYKSSEEVKVRIAEIEKLWKEEVFVHRFMGYPTSKEDIEDVCKAFDKVWKNRNELL